MKKVKKEKNKLSIEKKLMIYILSFITAFAGYAFVKESSNSKDKVIKLVNDNGEKLIVMALVDEDNKSIVGSELYGYIDKDLYFTDVIHDSKRTLELSSNYNFYYADYENFISKEEAEDNEILLNTLKEYSEVATPYSSKGMINFVDDKKQIKLKKLDPDNYYDDELKIKELIK